jgi:hypothetical protein
VCRNYIGLQGRSDFPAYAACFVTPSDTSLAIDTQISSLLAMSVEIASVSTTKKKDLLASPMILHQQHSRKLIHPTLHTALLASRFDNCHRRPYRGQSNRLALYLLSVIAK